jgi:hypothetical protein
MTPPPHSTEFIPNFGNIGHLVRKVTQEKYGKVEWVGGRGGTMASPLFPFNTLQTGDADLRFYITTVQDG